MQNASTTPGKLLHERIKSGLVRYMESDLTGDSETFLCRYRDRYGASDDTIVTAIASALLMFYSHYKQKGLEEERILHFLINELAFKLSHYTIEPHLFPKVAFCIPGDKNNTYFTENKRWYFYIGLVGEDYSLLDVEDSDYPYYSDFYRHCISKCEHEIGTELFTRLTYEAYIYDSQSGRLSVGTFHVSQPHHRDKYKDKNKKTILSFSELLTPHLLVDRLINAHIVWRKKNNVDRSPLLLKQRDINQRHRKSAAFQKGLGSIKGAMLNGHILHQYESHSLYADFYISQKTMGKLLARHGRASKYPFIQKSWKAMTGFHRALKRREPETFSVLNKISIETNSLFIFNYINSKRISPKVREYRINTLLNNRMFIRSLVGVLSSSGKEPAKMRKAIDQGEEFSPITYISWKPFKWVKADIFKSASIFIKGVDGRIPHRYGDMPIEEIMKNIAKMPVQLVGTLHFFVLKPNSEELPSISQEGNLVSNSFRPQSYIEPLFHIGKQLFPKTRQEWRDVFALVDNFWLNRLYTEKTYSGLGHYYSEAKRLQGLYKPMKIIDDIYESRIAKINEQYFQDVTKKYYRKLESIRENWEGNYFCTDTYLSILYQKALYWLEKGPKGKRLLKKVKLLISNSDNTAVFGQGLEAIDRLFIDHIPIDGNRFKQTLTAHFDQALPLLIADARCSSAINTDNIIPNTDKMYKDNLTSDNYSSGYWVYSIYFEEKLSQIDMGMIKREKHPCYRKAIQALRESLRGFYLHFLTIKRDRMESLKSLFLLRKIFPVTDVRTLLLEVQSHTPKGKVQEDRLSNTEISKFIDIYDAVDVALDKLLEQQAKL